MGGMHLMLDGEVSRLLALHQLEALLPHLVLSIGMTPVGGPCIKDHPWGPSGWQMMSESHIVFDYWYRRAVTIDLVCCRPFPVEETVELLKKSFDVTRVTMTQVFARGPSRDS